ncbi:MAG: hypothetical protein Fur0026_04630 [Sideroxydans sp.]
MYRYLSLFFMGLISCGLFAATEENNSLANSFVKADFKQEMPVPKLTRLLGAGGGFLFIAKEDGTVVVMSVEGKTAYMLADKSGEVQLLERPEAVAVADDIIYVVDSGTDQVLLYALKDGKYLGRFGAGAGGVFGGGDDQNLDAPRGIAVREGVVYVADTGNKRIQLFGLNGVFLHTLDLGTATPARDSKEPSYQLQKPTDIALDDSGRIYVLDVGDETVKVYDANGRYLRAFAEVASPIALTVAEDGVYIADERSQTVSKFDFDGKLSYQFGSKGEGKSQNREISGLASEKGQQLFIGDAERALVNVFQTVAGARIELVPRSAGKASVKWLWNADVNAVDLAGDGKGAVYAIGQQDNDGLLWTLRDGKVAHEILLKEMEPIALATDAAGNIWILDKEKKRVVKLDESGKELLAFGGRGSNAGQFSEPTALAATSNGLIFVADRGRSSVQVFRADGVFLSQLNSGAAKIKAPVALGVDPSNNLFVLDAERGSVLVYAPDGAFMYEFGRSKEGSQFVKPHDLAVTTDEVLVLDGSQVKAFDFKGQLLRVFGAKATGTASLGEPVALAASGSSTLYVANRQAKRVSALSILYKPQQPLQFQVQPGVHAISLQWAQPTAGYVKAFRVYRSKQENAGYVRVATVETNAYRDEDLDPGVRYFYRIAALSDLGFEGATSAPASGVPEKHVPSALAAVKVETGPWQAKLNWDAVDPKYFAAYRIYQKEGENFVKIGEVTEPAFIKDGLQPETKYTFYVSVVGRDDTESEKLAVEAITEVFSRPPLEIEVVRLSDVFSNSYKLYESNGVGVIRLTNNTDRKMEKVRVSFLLKNFMDFATESKVAVLLPGQSEELPLMAVFNNSILTMTEDSSVQALIEASYFDKGKRETFSRNATVNVYDKHRLTWDERGRFAVFVTPKDEPVLNLARNVVGEYKETKDEAQLAAALFDALGVFGLTYIQDPSNPYQLTSGKANTVDYLQFPRETLERKSGDCDDLVAVYSSGLESMGIATRVLEVPGHMLMMFNTGIPTEGDGYTMNNLYVIHEGTLWIPVETTLVGNAFIKAWEKGSETYYKYKDNGLTVLDVHGAWETFKPASLPASDWKASGLTRTAIENKFPGDILSVLKISSQTKTRHYLDILETQPNDIDAHLQIGIILARIGDRKEAMKYFDKIISLDAKNADAWNNRGNLLMIEDKYQDAVKAYRTAQQTSPQDAQILVNLARAYKRLGDTKNAKAAFTKAKQLNPAVQKQYRALALELLNAL